MQMLKRLGAVGTTFRRANQADLLKYNADVAHPEAQRQQLEQLKVFCQFEELVFLQTCNRVEWFFIAPPDQTIQQCRQRIFTFWHPQAGTLSAQAQQHAAAKALHAFAGEGAVEHLFLVAASLDSMVAGEAQILGQVKNSLQQACHWQLAGKQLDYVFQQAFQTAKMVRQHTQIGRGALSMVSLAFDALQAKHAPLHALEHIVIVGTGPMSVQCANYAKRYCPNAKRLFVNRTHQGAQQLAEQHGGKSMPLQDFLQAPPYFELLLTATAAPKPLFDAKFWRQCPNQRPYAVDFAIQRDIDADALHLQQGTLLDLDYLKTIAHTNQQLRHTQLAQARSLIDQALETFRRRLIEREVAEATQYLRHQFATTLQQSLTHLFAQQLPASPDAAQEKIQRWAKQLVQKLAHVPTVGLKHVGLAHGTEAVDTFLHALSAEKPPAGAHLDD